MHLLHLLDFVMRNQYCWLTLFLVLHGLTNMLVHYVGLHVMGFPSVQYLTGTDLLPELARLSQFSLNFF